MSATQENSDPISSRQDTFLNPADESLYHGIAAPTNLTSRIINFSLPLII